MILPTPRLQQIANSRKPEMKIALIDNMNNSFFSLCRYLRDEGIDAHLFCMPGPEVSEHFRPQADTFQDVSRCDWILDFPVNAHWLKSFFSRFRDKLETLGQYDLIIACGPGLAYLYRAGIKTDIFIPYGSDLYELPFPMINSIRTVKDALIRVARAPLLYYQRTAIQNSRVIIVNSAHRLYQAALDRLSVQNINAAVPFLYKEQAESETIGSWSSLNDHDFVVFNHSRHIWTSNPDFFTDFATHGGNKRNDKVIRAFARFLPRTGFKKPLLVTFEYGPDVDASKKLIHDLGIEGNVAWFPTMERKHILQGLKLASLGTDQLRTGICGIGGTGIEVMASGVPLLTHTCGAVRDPAHFFYNAPIIDVLEEDEIFRVFVDYEQNSEKYKSIGVQSGIWFEEHYGRELARKYARLIELLASKPHLTQESPEVRAILSEGGNTAAAQANLY